MKKEKLWTKNFTFISGANFFLFISYYSLLTVLPQAAIAEFQSSSSVAGLFTTLYLGAAIIIRPFLGSWIDRFGKKPILLAAFVIFTIISLLYGFFNSVVILLVLRFLQGLGFGMATTSTGGVAADVIPNSRKGEGMGYFVMSNNLGMVVGPFIGITVYSQYGITMLFFIVFICSFMALLFSMFTRLPKQEVQVQPGQKGEKPPIFEKGAVPIGITGAFLAISYSSILSFMTVFASQRGLAEESSYFFVVYAIVLLLSRPFTGVWFDRYGPNSVIYPCIVIFAIGMLVLGFAHGAMLFYIAAALIGLSWGTLFSSFQTLAIQRSNPKRSSVATATYLSIFDIGIGGGSFLVGALGDYIEIGTMYIYFSAYILAGLIIYNWAQKKDFSKSFNEQKQIQQEAEGV